MAALAEALLGIGTEIERDFAAGNQGRAGASGKLAGSLVTTLGGTTTRAELPWLVRFGEQFFRWQLFSEGSDYFRAVFKLVAAQEGGVESSLGEQCVALVGGFGVLAGDDNPNTQRGSLGLASRIYGVEHPFTRALQAKVAGGAPASAAGKPPTGAMKQASMAPAPVAAPPQDDAKAKRIASLWLTMAFMRLATADGKLDEKEYLVWKRAIASHALPDVWDEFGGPELLKMANAGELQALSAPVSQLPKDLRVSLGKVLVEVMFADGKLEQAELATVAQLVRWIGLTLDDVGVVIQQS